MADFGAAVYGAVRGVQDAEKFDMEKRGFEADQAIRRERLSQEQELRPLRRRALEVGTSEAEAEAAHRGKLRPIQEELAGVGLKLNKMSLDEQTAAAGEMRRAREEQTKMREALRELGLSGDPQKVIDVMIAGGAPAMQGMKAVRDDTDKSIKLVNGEGQVVKVFPAGKRSDGTEFSPDDSFAHFAMTQLDPVKHMTARLQQEYEMEKQRAITGRNESVARIRAGATENRRDDSWYNRNHTMLNRDLDAALKGDSTPGSFISGYTHADDKELRSVIAERAADLIDEGHNSKRATRRAIDETREAYDDVAKKAATHAKALSARKIDPRKEADLDKAAKAGDKDAIALQKELKIARALFGPSVAKYLAQNLSTK
jgi:hypothetical protein